MWLSKTVGVREDLMSVCLRRVKKGW